MLNLKLNQDKSLSVSNPKGTKIYQNDNLIDKLRVWIPKEYAGHDLTDFAVVLNYITPGNIPHNEQLKQQGEEKENYISYIFNVGTDFTAIAGEIKDISLLLTKQDNSGEKPVIYKLHSGTTSLTVYPSTDINNYTIEIVGETGGEYEVVEF